MPETDNPGIIQRAVWLYFRFPLSFRDVEDLLAERGIDISYESVRRWSVKFDLAYAYKLGHSRPRPDAQWHLDEVFVSINGSAGIYDALSIDTRIAGYPGSIPEKQEGSAQTDAQTAQETRFCP